MEDLEIINLWKTQSAKLDQSLAINTRLLSAIQTQKAQNALQSLKQLKIGGVITGVLYIVFLAWILSIALRYTIANNSSAAYYFIGSITLISLINIKAVYDYIKHLIWMNQINYDGSIAEVQQKLNHLKLSIIQHSRIMFLQMPFYTTFYLSNSWFPQTSGWAYLLFQFLLTGAFCYASYWCYKTLDIKNVNSKWFKFLIAGSGGKSVSKAMGFYNELEELKK
jgi:hypothetical protein